MKRGNFSTSSTPTIRILLVAPHLYQVSLRNIYGYLKTVLLDRCKKVGAQYRHFEKSYFVDSKKLLELKKEFEDVQKDNSDAQLKFKIEDFPMTNIKMIMKQDKNQDSNQKSKHRIILLDRYSENRYFYAKKKIEQMFTPSEKERLSKQPNNLLILTSQINKKLWTSVVLKKKKTETKQELFTKAQSYELIELTSSQLTSKKPNQPQFFKLPNSNVQNEPNKIYIITYHNLKFLQGSWFVKEMKNVDLFFTDDAQFLVSSQSQLSTIEIKQRNFGVYKLLLQNYNIENELIVFFSKLPEPCDIFKLLILIKPANFSGINFATSFNNYFNDQKLTSEERKMYEEYTSWFKKRYRVENKCFKEIMYLLSNVVLKSLDENVFKRTPNLLPSLELSPILQEYYQITLIESYSELTEKFKTMEKKYNGHCQTINLQKILKELHDKEKSEQRKFQTTTNSDDYLISKHAKSYFFEAREVMLNSKIEAILRRIFFVINTQKQRIAVVVEDEKFEQRLKKYLKQTQIQFIDYKLAREKQQIRNLPIQKASTCSEVFSKFDSNSLIQVCIINISRLYKYHNNLVKERKKKAENDYENDHDQKNDRFQLFIPKITTASSIHFIDSFWYEFCFEKELLLNEIFNYQFSYIQEVKEQRRQRFRLRFKRPQVPSNYYLFERSYEKMMLEKFLQRKEDLQSFKVQSSQTEGKLITNFVNEMFSTEKIKFQNLNCSVIDYLDIDEEYDKIEEEAKRAKCLKGAQALEEKVFLPKFTKPQNKSFKQLIEEKLNKKNIDQILDDSDQIFNYDLETMAETPPIIPDKQAEQPQKRVQTKTDNVSEVMSMNLKENINSLEKSSIDRLLPEIQPQTIRLQSSYFDQSFKLKSQIFENYQENEPEKDLFDQLLEPDPEADCLSKYLLEKKYYEPEDVQTESEYDEDKNLKRLRKSSETKLKIEPKSDESLLFQNFGYMAYHKKEWLPQQQFNSPKLKTENNSKFTEKHQTSEKSIEIIMPDEIIDVQKINPVKAKKRLRLGQPRRMKQIIQQKVGPIPFYEESKEKRLSNKKLYEEAISKSKQLWEKKLRKQKETIILPPKKFELSMLPKPGWRESLTEAEVKQLKEKGINL